MIETNHDVAKAEADELGASRAAAGTLIGNRYRVTEAIQKGPLCETFLATDLERNAPVVVKVLPTHAVAARAQMRFEHEFSVLREMKGPWLAPWLDVGRAEKYWYLVRPLVAGMTLKARLARGPLGLDESLAIATCLLSTLKELHARGLLHRDIRPVNLIVPDQWPLTQAVLVDCDLARVTQGEASLDDHSLETAR
jgi:serine/threonine protein kinase